MDQTIPQPPNSGQSESESEALMRFQGGYFFTEAPPKGPSFAEGGVPFANEATPPMPRADRCLATEDYRLCGGLAPSKAVHPEIDHWSPESFYSSAEDAVYKPMKRKTLRDS
jgi:hypothetical protein